MGMVKNLMMLVVAPIHLTFKAFLVLLRENIRNNYTSLLPAAV